VKNFLACLHTPAAQGHSKNQYRGRRPRAIAPRAARHILWQSGKCPRRRRISRGSGNPPCGRGGPGAGSEAEADPVRAGASRQAAGHGCDQDPPVTKETPAPPPPRSSDARACTGQEATSATASAGVAQSAKWRDPPGETTFRILHGEPVPVGARRRSPAPAPKKRHAPHIDALDDAREASETVPAVLESAPSELPMSGAAGGATEFPPPVPTLAAVAATPRTQSGLLASLVSGAPWMMPM
jgi:hypothetical protein